jgi:hypothetical protein
MQLGNSTLNTTAGRTTTELEAKGEVTYKFCLIVEWCLGEENRKN